MTSTTSRSETDDDRWYFGRISHKAASDLLINAGAEEGTFLVRESCSSPGNYVLSLISEGLPVDILISNFWQDAFYSLITDPQKIHHGLDSLIAHYCENPVAAPAGTVLYKPCVGDSPPPETRLHGSSNLLHRAVSQVNLKVVTELLKSGYRKIDAKNHQGQTALHIACNKMQDDLVKLLIKNSATVDVRDEDGLTPLQHACRHNFSTIVTLLIEDGRANVQLRSPATGEVPLHDAATYGSIDAVRILLSYQAPAWPRSFQSNTPALLAKIHNHSECHRIIANHRPPFPQVRLPEYYHGGITRNDAYRRLVIFGKGTGRFLLRKSSTREGIFVLSLTEIDQVYHFEIQKQKRMYFIDDGPYFRCLETLVDHYSRFTDGLPCRLQEPIAPAEPLEEDAFKQIYFEDSNGNCMSDSSCSLLESQPLLFGGSLEDMLSSDEATAIEGWIKGPATKVTSLTDNAVLGASNDLHIDLRGIQLQGPLSSPPPSETTPLIESLEMNMKGNKTEEILGTIDTDSLEVGPSLGIGEFGSVLRGIWTGPSGDKIEVAVKTMHDNNPINKKNFLNEAQVMMNLNHPYIVKLLGVCHGPPLAMVQELAPMGSLLDYLLDHPQEIQPNFHVKLWAAQVADGMSYLEEKHFVHRDLAARNLLLTSATLVKISDFGLSRALGVNNDYTATQGGKWPLKWYAPESIYFGQFTNLSDVWSYGVSLWELYTFGDEPYGDLTGNEVVALLDKDARLPKPPGCPDRTFSLMLSCWATQPTDRPCFKKISNIFRGSPDYVHVKPYIKRT